jgi:phosphopantothenate-cysteine ligase/phosphopantothenoylcysteine decarboxylase/phosphopantothenate--cysteine ligase
MAREIPGAGYGAIVHSAAVSDYEVRNILTPVSDFHDASMAFHGPGPHFRDSRQSKVKSSHPEVWLRMVPTAKLVDSIRKEWNFRGVLVKFKLEVGVTDAELLAVAERSRVQSGAEILVANTFEGRHDWAYLLTDTSSPYRVNRSALAHTLMDAVEQRHR